MNEDIVIPFIVFSSITIIVIGLPIARAMARRMDRQSVQPPMSAEVLSKLDRMEHAIDSIAIEVERISEGQRFTTRLLSDRTGAVGGAPDAVEVQKR